MIHKLQLYGGGRKTGRTSRMMEKAFATDPTGESTVHVIPFESYKQIIQHHCERLGITVVRTILGENYFTGKDGWIEHNAKVYIHDFDAYLYRLTTSLDQIQGISFSGETESKEQP